MRLLDVEYLNWCQYRQRREAFHPGLTAIIGANGSGKSNFLGGVRWLLTGVNPNPGTLGDNISQFAGAGENSFGVLTVSHGNVCMRITRHLLPESRKSKLELMALPGSLVEGIFSPPGTPYETINGDKKVNPRIEEILGTDFDTINEIGLVAQEDIFGFLAKKPSQRAAAFQKLFRTQDAVRVYDALGKHMSGIQVPQVGAELDALLQQRSEVAPYLVELEQEDRQLPPAAELTTAQGVDQHVLLDHAQLTHYRETAQTCASSEQRYSVQMHLAEASAIAAQRDVDTLQNALNSAGPLAREAQDLLARAEQASLINASRAELQHLIDKTLVGLEQAAPVPPSNYATDLPALNAELLAVQQKVQRDEQMVRDLALTGRSECPTCHTKVEGGLAIEIARAQRELPQDKVRRQQLMDSERATKTHDAHVAAHRLRIQGLEEHLERLRHQQGALQVLAVPSYDHAQLQERIATAAAYEDGLREYQKVLHDRQRELAGVQGALAEARRGRADAERLMQTIIVDDEHVRVAQAQVLVREQQIARRQVLDPELARYRTTKATLDRDIQQLQEQRRIALQRRGWLDFAGSMRDIVHWENLPTWTIRRNLQRLSVITNETLELFQTDFRVEADNELTFRAHFTDGRTQTAERLSWGQKVVLALAVRLGLNLRVAPDLGFLGLDEPTAYLDKHHIRGFPPVLARLRLLASSRSLQCVMVTHEDTLGPLFDKVIQL